MTKEEIFKMAEQAGWKWPGIPIEVLLERFAALVAEHERKRCCSLIFGMCESDNVAQRTVDAIRKGK